LRLSRDCSLSADYVVRWHLRGCSLIFRRPVRSSGAAGELRNCPEELDHLFHYLKTMGNHSGNKAEVCRRGILIQRCSNSRSHFLRRRLSRAKGEVRLISRSFTREELEREQAVTIPEILTQVPGFHSDESGARGGLGCESLDLICEGFSV
jgi:hypothetical protein